MAIIFAIYFILDFLNSSYEGITQTGFEDLANLVPLCVGIAYGMMGNGFFLQEIVRKFNSGHRGLIPKSNLNIFIFIVVILIFSALSETFSFN